MGFKKGDTVVCDTGYAGMLTQGKFYEVSSDQHDGNRFVQVIDDLGNDGGWWANRFKLATTASPAAPTVKLFRRGDLVICVSSGPMGVAFVDASDRLTVGRLYTVMKDQPAVGHSLWVVDNDGNISGFLAGRFVAHSDAVESTIKSIKAVTDENTELKYQNVKLLNQVENLKNDVQQQADRATRYYTIIEAAKSSLKY